MQYFLIRDSVASEVLIHGGDSVCVDCGLISLLVFGICENTSYWGLNYGGHLHMASTKFLVFWKPSPLVCKMD